MSLKRWIACVAGTVGICLLSGCEGRPSLIPNSDPALQKTSTQFAADAVKRFPYPGRLMRAGDAQGRAQVDLMMATLQILNYDDRDWNNIDVWVNHSYVCHVPKIPKGKQKVETLNFQMLYNAQGDYFWTDGGKHPMREVEMVRDGKIYQIPLVLAD